MKAALPQLSASDAFGALDQVDALVFLTVEGEDGGTLLGRGPSADLIAAYGIDVPSLLTQLEITGEVGQVRTLPLPPLAGDDRWAHLPRTVMFAGIGTSTNDTGSARLAGAGLIRACNPGSTIAVAGFDATSDAVVTAFGEGILLGAYRHPF